MQQVTRLINSQYYVNLSEGCVYCGDAIVEEINSAIHLRILEYFAFNSRLWLSRDMIIDNCWPDHYVTDATFYSTMSKLRGIHPEIADSIESRKGIGYRYLGSKLEDSKDMPVSRIRTESAQIHKEDPAFLQQPFDPDNVCAASYYDLLQHGYTSDSIAASLVENDYKLYNVAPENEGTSSQWKEYLSSFPETFQYIVDKRNWAIVGNFSFLSVTESIAEQILAGTYLEKDLNPALTRDLFSAGADHILFLLNMSLNEEYATTRNYTMLRQMFLKQLLRYAEDDIYFKKIITNVYRPNQEAFFRQWGFRFVTEHSYTGKIYAIDMYPYPEKLDHQLQSNSKLQEINERLKEQYDRQHQLLSADSRKRIIR